MRRLATVTAALAVLGWTAAAHAEKIVVEYDLRCSSGSGTFSDIAFNVPPGDPRGTMTVAFQSGATGTQESAMINHGPATLKSLWLKMPFVTTPFGAVTGTVTLHLKTAPYHATGSITVTVGGERAPITGLTLTSGSVLKNQHTLGSSTPARYGSFDFKQRAHCAGPVFFCLAVGLTQSSVVTGTDWTKIRLRSLPYDESFTWPGVHLDDSDSGPTFKGFRSGRLTVAGAHTAGSFYTGAHFINSSFGTITAHIVGKEISRAEGTH